MVDYLMTGSYWPLVYKYWPANYWVGLVVGLIDVTLFTRPRAVSLDDRDRAATLFSRPRIVTPEDER